MGRTNSMMGPVPGALDGPYAAATYGVAGELLSLTGIGSSQTFEYNTLGKLTAIRAGSLANLEYEFVAGQNNGRIAKARERNPSWQITEEITYTYDELNRLTQASAAQWEQGFG
jgi:hypothetical protein